MQVLCRVSTLFTSPHQGRAKGESSLPQPAAQTLLSAPQDAMAFLATRAPCWLMGNLLPTRTPRPFCKQPLSNKSVPNLCWWVLPPQGQDSTLALVVLYEVPSPPTLQPGHVSLDGSNLVFLILQRTRNETTSCPDWKRNVHTQTRVGFFFPEKTKKRKRSF